MTKLYRTPDHASLSFKADSAKLVYALASPVDREKETRTPSSR